VAVTAVGSGLAVARAGFLQLQLVGNPAGIAARPIEEPMCWRRSAKVAWSLALIVAASFAANSK
jgi:hypothetical protein